MKKRTRLGRNSWRDIVERVFSTAWQVGLAALGAALVDGADLKAAVVVGGAAFLSFLKNYVRRKLWLRDMIRVIQRKARG